MRIPKYSRVEVAKITYKISEDGVYYHHDTPDDLLHLLELHRVKGTYLRFHWGDMKTGLDWGDAYGIRGRMGKSVGPVIVPILLPTRRSLGGAAVLTDHIVMVTMQGGLELVWKHPHYHTINQRSLMVA